ncbi:hypothetical protein ACFC1R_25005 [Kitasatospora sp. NPDC056138]|uniref:hypothetical protein n=1 Tax=Kitasatospora sp. NPDC056138 TaxID=3345724 RepID=UPI0035E30DE3
MGRREESLPPTAPAPAPAPARASAPAPARAGAPALPGGREQEYPSAPVSSVDPVRELVERHRALCEQAVDPLDIAVGLEEAGLGRIEAGRYRQADVFELADELYARVPRRPAVAAPEPPAPSWRSRTGRALGSAVRYGLPSAVPVALRAATPVVGVPLLALALAVSGARPAGAALRRWSDSRSGAGAPGAGGGSPVAARLWYGLGAGVLLGVPVLTAGPAGAALGLAAALCMGSVEWSADWLRHAAGLGLGSAGTLSAFRARMRPVLPVALGLHLALLALFSFAALAVLTALDPGPGTGSGAGAGLLTAAARRASGLQWAAQAALGLLLVPAAALLRTGRSRSAAAAVPTAGLGSAVCTAVRAPETAQLLCCGTAAALLLPYAWTVLGRPGAYRLDGPPA